jgi:hypothetical protein
VALSKRQSTRIEEQTGLKSRDPFVSWEIVDVQFPSTPDTDLVIRHNLHVEQPRDVHYRVIKQFTQGDVYETVEGGSTKWTTDYIVLRSDFGGWTGRLLLGVLDRIVEFDSGQFSIPPFTDCCSDPSVGGTECLLHCTTAALQPFPPADDGVTLTPTGVAWANTAFVEIIPSAAEDLILGSIILLPGTVINGNFFEVDLATGSLGNETVVATVQGATAQHTGPVGVTHTMAIPCHVINSGDRVSLRLRQASSDTTAWKAAIQCYSKATWDSEGISYASSGPEVWPEMGSKTSVSPNGSTWANGNWAEVVAATGTDWIVSGLLAYGPPSGTNWEIDIGTGTAGNEVVVTTIRGRNDRFFIPSILQGGVFHYNLKPCLDNIPAGSRVAVRIRKQDTDTTNWTMALSFYREHVPAYTTSQPQVVSPAAATPHVVTSGGGANVYGSWVEVIANTSAPIAITSLVIGQNGNRQIIDFGVGSAGNEATIGTWTAQGNNGDQWIIPFNVALYVAAGQRLCMRTASNPFGGVAFSYAFTYIEDPVFTHLSTDVQFVLGTGSGTLNTSPTPWANNNWTQISSGLAAPTRLHAIAWDIPGAGAEVEVDVGVGAAGFEQVVTTFRYAQHENTSSSGNHFAHFPTGHCLDTGSRVAVRTRSNVASLSISYISLMGSVNGGTTGGGCGPGALTPGVPNVIQQSGNPADNELARFDQDGQHIQGTGIFVADGENATLSGTNTGDQLITLTGDVTGSGQDTFAATIVSNAVTYSKMQDISAASRLLGRGSASGAGDPQEITLGSGLSLSGTTLSVVAGSANKYQLGITIDGGGSVITTGTKGFITVPISGTITAATVLSTDGAATAGDIVVDVWKDTYANYPPTVADSITDAAPPTLSSANKSQDTTLTGWTTNVTAGDILGFNVDSVATVTRVTVVLTITP